MAMPYTALPAPEGMRLPNQAALQLPAGLAAFTIVQTSIFVGTIARWDKG